MTPKWTRTLIAAGLATAAFAGYAAQDPATNKAPDLLMKTSLSAPIYIVGIQVRTDNASEMSGHGEIGKLWGRFLQQNLAAQIPHRTGESLMAVYSNYASDEKGTYDYLLGVPVSSIDNLPTGLSFRRIPPGEYAIITTEKGNAAEVVPAAWKRIWAMTPTELGGHRAFLADYEVYYQRSADPANARVEIHLGLKPAS
jgi:predicted transcriptional regulator YdeE